MVIFLDWKAKKSETEQVILEEGQSFVYGQIVSIHGNEITYEVALLTEREENSIDKMSEEEKGGERPSMWEGTNKERPSMPERTNGERPQMWGNNGSQFKSQSQRESRQEIEEGTAEKMLGEENWERPRMSEGMGQTMSQRGSLQISQYEMTGETATVQIPVGTLVTTKLGTVTTFSRLAAGDNIKMLVQEEEGETIVLEVWILE